MEKLTNLSPFQCFLINGVESILVNFGTVLCPTINGVDNIFIPTISGSPIVRFRQPNFSSKNLLTLPSDNEVICLKIKLENIEQLVSANVTIWENAALYGSQPAFVEIFNKSMNLELQRDYFNIYIDGTQSVENVDFTDDSFLDDVIASNLNPIVSWSPRVTSVEIITQSFGDYSVAESESKYSLIQNDGEYYKLVPISIVENGVLTQLIDFDYVFSFPFYWLDNLKQSFKNVPS